MNLDMNVLLWGLLFSSIGMGYFIYGKRQSQPVVRYAGLALMIYPYFIEKSLPLVVLGLLLMLVPRFIKA